MQLISQQPFQITMPTGTKIQNSVKGLQWPKQDFIKYAVFVVFQAKLKDSLQELNFNSWSFFRQLSLFVQSKNPNQCRIHHRKMMKPHPSINSLATHLSSTVHKFQEWYAHYEGTLSNLRSCLLRERKQIQKEHTGSQKITIKINSKEQKEGFSEFSKKEDNEPTGVSYKDEDESNNKASHLFNQPSRPSFSLSEELYDGGVDDLTFLSKRPVEVRPSFLEEGDKWKDCHNGLVSYMGKLQSLLNSSVYDL